jgi:hypothetical protein
MTSQLHNAALALAKRGCAIFPCQPRGKNPVSRDGFKAATTNIRHIETWWSTGPDCNIGIATGTPSGFWVLDIDGDEGEVSLRKLEEVNGPLPSTVEAITGKGRHCYFRIGEHGPVGNSAGQIAIGLDVRGEGGYVLAPPSVHPSGRAYAWSVDSAKDFAEAPDWFYALINANDTGGKGKPLAHWHETLTKRIADGTRNVTLTSVAGKLIREGVDVILVYDLLTCVNIARCAPPLPDDEIKTIVQSVMTKHLQANLEGAS